MAKTKFINSIKTKIIFFLTIFLIAIIVGNLLLFKYFIDEYRNQKKIGEIYMSSVDLLTHLDNLNKKSLLATQNLVFVDKNRTDTISSIEQITGTEYSKYKDSVIWYVEQWDKDEQNMYFNTMGIIDSMFNIENTIDEKYKTFANYNNPETYYQTIYYLGNEGKLFNYSQRISQQILNIKKSLYQKTEKIKEQTQKQFLFLKRFILYLILLLIALFILLIIFVFRMVYFTQNRLNPIIDKLSKGVPVEIKKSSRKDEFGEIYNYLVNFVSYLKEVATFADKIGNNEFDYKFSPLSDKDVLGNSLIKMRDNLLKAQEEERKRQEENKQRNWSSQGIAHFNEVIRSNNNDLNELTNAVIKELVDYTGAGIGGLYIVDEEAEKPLIKLQAFYAYDRHKFMERTIHPGETLVGQCYIENDTIYINDVPDDYIYITSGLGKDKPRSILIVPLQFNEQTYGIIELASFEEMSGYKIEFIERISETIASAISTAKINERTAKLLEETNQKTKLLEDQEKIAKQNIEKVKKQLEELEEKYKNLEKEKNQYLSEKVKLQTELEEINKQLEEKTQKEQEKYRLLQHTIDKVVPYFELSINGDVLYANDLYCQILKQPKEEILRSKHTNFVFRDFINSGQYKKIWDKVKNKNIVETSMQYTINGKNKLINEKFVPVTDKLGNLLKISVFVLS